MKLIGEAGKMLKRIYAYISFTNILQVYIICTWYMYIFNMRCHYVSRREGLEVAWKYPMR